MAPVSLTSRPALQRPAVDTSRRRPVGAVPDAGGERRAAGKLRRTELGLFLRSRRQRIAPEQVGLPLAGRRRTPGLRREEVATLAGVGVTWYTWLEQGRDIRASEQVLEAIARTLQFDAHERSHLFTLAGTASTPLDEDGNDCVPRRIHTMLEALHPYPANVVNSRYDILAYNQAYRFLISDIEQIPPEERNTMWLLFTNPEWRSAVADREETTRRMVAQFRALMAQHVAEPPWKCLVHRLSVRSPEFAALWDRHDVEAPEGRVKKFRLESGEVIRLDFTYLWLGQRLGSRMVTYTPSDSHSDALLREHVERRMSRVR